MSHPVLIIVAFMVCVLQTHLHKKKKKKSASKQTFNSSLSLRVTATPQCQGI